MKNPDKSPHNVCRFCNLISSGKPQTLSDRILAENDSHFAISSIGGFVPGWTLIFPKNHKPNLSEDYLASDFHSFASYVEDTVAKEYGNCVIFEHGSNAEGSATSCGVNHAHMHIVPFDGDIEFLAQRETSELEWLRAAISEISELSNHQEYLYCAKSLKESNTSGMFTILENPRSQFFRKVLAKAVGLSEFYDYKRYRFEDISKDTAERLSKQFLLSTSV